MDGVSSSWSVGGLLFSCDFECGNLGKVTTCDNSRTFCLWIRSDNAGTEGENGNRTWFYFSVSGAKKGQLSSFVIMNMNTQIKLYSEDYRILHRTLPSNPEWARIPLQTQGQIIDDHFRVKFRYRFEYEKETVYFAFCYPYSYSDLQNKLSYLDETQTDLFSKGIYFNRSLLTSSVLGNRVDLVTITSTNNILDGSEEERQDGLFPDYSQPLPLKLKKKPVIFLTARVHPGETPSSFVIDGAILFALNSADPRARIIREEYIIKIIPMLNPDGVIVGNYRTDTNGVNLNRFYDNPDINLHPSIFATQKIFLKYHQDYGIRLYVDCHAHATKKGCFMYGNFMVRDEDFTRTVSFCKVLSLNTPYFDMDQCNFSRENMVALERKDVRTKESCGRVALYYQTGVVQSYTLECNYNAGKSLRKTASVSGGSANEVASSQTNGPQVYTQKSWADIGKAILISAIDMDEINPFTRIANTDHRDLKGVRQWVSTYGRSKIGLTWEASPQQPVQHASHTPPLLKIPKPPLGQKLKMLSPRPPNNQARPINIPRRRNINTLSMETPPLATATTLSTYVSDTIPTLTSTDRKSLVSISKSRSTGDEFGAE